MGSNTHENLASDLALVLVVSTRAVPGAPLRPVPPPASLLRIGPMTEVRGKEAWKSPGLFCFYLLETNGFLKN